MNTFDFLYKKKKAKNREIKKKTKLAHLPILSSVGMLLLLLPHSVLQGTELNSATLAIIRPEYKTFGFFSSTSKSNREGLH